MIGILQNPKLTAAKLGEIAAWHWGVVKTLISQYRGTADGGETVADMEKEIAPHTFEEIAKADYRTLEKLKAALPHDKIAKYTAGKKHFFVAIYENYRKKYGQELVTRLQLTVCPYCNRNFINNGGTYTLAQFDHFFPKSQYPIFALSVFNLIPSCSACNHRKGEEDFDLSPYDRSRTTDRLLRFSFRFDVKKQVEIDLDVLDPAFGKNVDILQLRELYSMHTDLVKELILKHMMYKKPYIASLESLFQRGQEVSMSFREFYYGNYLNERDYYLRPLSKFTHDMIQELENDGAM